MRIGVPREVYEGERRVATTPEVAAQLIKLGFEVAVESGAGAASSYSDAAYTEAGCDVIGTAGRPGDEGPRTGRRGSLATPR